VFPFDAQRERFLALTLLLDERIGFGARVEAKV
jgi:hypothetical protein